MYHLATFTRESSAERIAGRMELQRIRTGLTGGNMTSGDTVFNLFVPDRQAEVAERLLSDLFSDTEENNEILKCPTCGSSDVHLSDEHAEVFPLEPHFRLRQTSGPPIELSCKACGHRWG